jgi:mutator protein MutT
MPKLPHFVRVIIKDSAGNLLLLLEQKYKAWNFPGGKIEPGETPEMAAIREIKEEINLDLKNINFLFSSEITFPNNAVWTGTFYSAEADLFALKSNEPNKLIDMKFLSADEIKKLPRESVSNSVWEYMNGIVI